MKSSRLRILGLLLVLAATACAPATTGGRTSAGNAPITAEELESSRANDVYSAVQSLRPRWLRVQQIATNSASNAVVVYYGQSRLGGLESMRNVAIGDVSSVVFLRAAEAQLRFGNNHASGAIVLEPARQ
jgi:hypothetical protein